jgi:hypothetical protein
MSELPGPYVPSDGYQVPPTYGQYVPPFRPGGYDPLVPAPGSRFEGWWMLVVATFKRSARTLIMIFLLTSALPSLVVAVAGSATGAALALNPLTINEETGGISWNEGVIAGFLAAGVVFIFVTTFLNALGWGAGIYAVVQAAAGQPVSLAAAFRAGFRRVLPMWGWSLLCVLIIGVGTVLCVVPGLYFGLALSLFGFAVMFERGTSPIARSFRLVNNNFGAAIGRVALLVAMYVVVSFVVSCIVGVLVGLLGMSTVGAIEPSGAGAVGLSLGAQIVSSLIQEAVALPLLSFLLVGLMITYTQLRSNEAPLSTPQLWADAQ